MQVGGDALPFALLNRQKLGRQPSQFALRSTHSLAPRLRLHPPAQHATAQITWPAPFTDII